LRSRPRGDASFAIHSKLLMTGVLSDVLTIWDRELHLLHMVLERWVIANVVSFVIEGLGDDARIRGYIMKRARRIQ
jgi:hypothetical protein